MTNYVLLKVITLQEKILSRLKALEKRSSVNAISILLSYRGIGCRLSLNPCNYAHMKFLSNSADEKFQNSCTSSHKLEPQRPSLR